MVKPGVVVLAANLSGWWTLLPLARTSKNSGSEDGWMRLLIALLLPWLTFFTIGRPFAGIFCLLLQITIIGWLPATIWAVYALGQYKTDKKIAKALSAKA
ncbi:YqaE/Pmp3 family membrane protein [Hydrogenophaga sp. D2P1]|uniref:YqaE/Pmp3 family membrane protein n=2 Tax=Hydrogenophaga aromaticivorans TaxID=2610898 RepID=A0A7Y8GXZ4_9BURK|nr:YqaE/Pmp3 family membrane protein [Hydrogenophaga aromaticivorans]